MSLTAPAGLRPRAALGGILVGIVLAPLFPAAEAGTPTAVLDGGTLDGLANAISMDNGLLAAVVTKDGALEIQNDNEFFVYDVRSGSQYWSEDDSTLNGLLAEGKAVVAFAKGTPSGPNGPYVVAAEEVGATTGKTWFVFNRDPTSDRQAVASVGGHNDVRDLAISDNGEVIGVARGNVSSPSQNEQVGLYRYRGSTGGLEHVWNFTLFGTTSVGTAYDVAVSGNGQFLVAGADRAAAAQTAGAIYVFNTGATVPNKGLGAVAILRYPHQNVTDPVKKVAISGAGKYFVAADSDDSGSNIHFCTNRYPDGGNWIGCVQSKVEGQATSLALAYHGNDFAVGTDRGEVWMYKVRRDEQPEATVPSGTGRGSNHLLLGKFRTDGGAVASLAFSYNGQFLVAAGTNALYGFANTSAEPAWIRPLSVAGVAKPVVGADVSWDAERIAAIADNRLWIFQQTRGVTLTPDEPRKLGSPGVRHQFRITVTNTGSNADNFTLGVVPPSTPAGTWSDVRLNGSYAFLLPDRSLDMVLDATAPDNTLPGIYKISVEATSQNLVALGRLNEARKTLDVELEIGRVYGVELTPEVRDDKLNPGETKQFPFTLRNAGNADDIIRLTATDAGRSPGTQWSWSVVPDRVALAAFQSTTVNVEVRAIEVEDGDFLKLRVLGEAKEGEVDERDDTTLIVRVNPRFDAQLTPERADVSIEPGQPLLVNLSVKNLGNTGDTFTILNTTDPRNPVGWRISFSPSPPVATLDRQKTGTVRMTIRAPQAAQPGDVVTVNLELRSAGLDAKVDQTSVVATVVPKSVGGFLGLPGFEPLLLALAVGLAGRRAFIGAGRGRRRR